MSNTEFIYGLHAVSGLLDNSPSQIKHLWLNERRQDQRVQACLDSAKQHGVAVTFVDGKDLEKKAGTSQHQGIVAECQAYTAKGEADLLADLVQLSQPWFFLVLDGVQDPHNLGACLRSADAAGVSAVITSKDQSASITPVVRKVACGAVDTIPFYQVTNLARTLRHLQKHNIWIYGLMDSAKTSIYQGDLTGNIALVLGAEGKGLRHNTQKHCDEHYHIPMAGTVSSLNVSVATGVCLFEAVRQRGADKLIQ